MRPARTRAIQRKLTDVQELLLSRPRAAALLDGLVINVEEEGELLPG